MNVGVPEVSPASRVISFPHLIRLMKRRPPDAFGSETPPDVELISLPEVREKLIRSCRDVPELLHRWHKRLPSYRLLRYLLNNLRTGTLDSFQAPSVKNAARTKVVSRVGLRTALWERFQFEETLIFFFFF